MDAKDRKSTRNRVQPTIPRTEARQVDTDSTVESPASTGSVHGHGAPKTRNNPGRNGRIMGFMEWLQSSAALQCFAPPTAILYNLWAIPLRMSFVKDYTYDGKFAVFIAFDVLADVVLAVYLLAAIGGPPAQEGWRYTRTRSGKWRKPLNVESTVGGVHERSSRDRRRAVVNGGNCGTTTTTQWRLRRHSLQSVESIRNILQMKGTMSTDTGIGSAMSEYFSAFAVRILGDYSNESLRRFGLKLVTIASMVPLELFVFGVRYLQSGVAPANLAVFRSNRMLVLVLFPAMYAAMIKYVEKHKMLVNSGLQRMVFLFVLSAMSGHLASCAWFSAAWAEGKAGNPHNWAELDVEPLFGPVSDPAAAQDDKDGDRSIEMLMPWTACYLRSIYWALITMITTGFGDIVPTNQRETVVCCIAMYTGVLLCTISIANLTSLFLSMDRALTQHQAKMDALFKYTTYRRLPRDLTDRIMAFYEYTWVQLRGVDEQNILSELPTTLKQQVANEITCELLRNVPIFRSCEKALLNALASYVESHIFSPTDLIIHAGERDAGLQIISRGIALVYGEDRSKVLQRMSRGDFIGLLGLFGESRSHFNIAAKTYCEVFTLPAPAFVHLCGTQCRTYEVDTMREIALRAEKSMKKRFRLAGSFTETLDAVHGIRRHLLPSSHFRKAWDCILFLGTTYYCFSIPLWIAAAFPLDSSSTFRRNSVGLCFGYLVDLFFLVDVVLRLSLFYIIDDGVLISETTQIRDAFFRDHSALFEFVCCCPWDLIGFGIGARFCPLLRCTKLPQLLNLAHRYEKVERKAQSWIRSLSSPFKRFVKLNFAMYVACHWVGCIFIAIGRISQRRHEHNWIDTDQENGSFYIDFDANDPSNRVPTCLYLRAVYWAIVGMSTVGYGDIVPVNTTEMLFATLVVLFGGLTIPAMVGGLAACVSGLNQAEAQNQRRLSMIRGVLRRNDYARKDVQKVMQFFDYIWARQGGVDEAAILGELPAPLRQRVALSIAGKAVSMIPFFAHLPQDILKSIVTALTPRVFVPNDIIIRSGEVGTEMYIIERGTAHVCSPTYLITYMVLHDGDYFGESCLLKAKLRCSNVKCFSYCDCFELNKHGFHEAIDNYPEAREEILGGIEETLKEKVMHNRSVTNNFRHHSQRLLRRLQSSQVPPSTKSNGGGGHHRLRRNSHFPTQPLGQAPTSNADGHAWQTRWAEAIRRFWNRVNLFTFTHPDSTRMARWNVLLLIAILYNITMIPFQLAFLPPPTFFITGYVLDLVLLTNLVLRARFIGVEMHGEMLRDPAEIEKHYLSGRFKLDVVSVAPLEVVVLPILMLSRAASPQASNSLFSDHLPLVLAALRIPKALLASDLLPISVQIWRNLEDLPAFGRIVNNYSTLVSLFELLSGVVLVSHWAGCGFFAFARYRHYLASMDCESGDFESSGAFDTTLAASASAQCFFRDSWVALQIEDRKLPLGGYSLDNPPTLTGLQYVRALNWALPTLVVVVIGDVVPTTCSETLYVFICILLGMTVNAVIVGNIAGLVANLNTDSAAHITKSDALSAYLHQHRIPQYLHHRVRTFMAHVWTHHHGTSAVDEHNIMNQLPLTLQIRLAESSKLDYIRKCPFFDFCSNEIVRALAVCLRTVRFSKGDVIVQYGDLGAEMFFVVSGSVEVVSADASTVYATLNAGAFFGETALFFKQHRSATILASEFCELLILTKRDLDRELVSREFDLSRMIGIFEDIQASNLRRNKSLADNLKQAKNDPTCKLHKLVQQAIEADEAHGPKYHKAFFPESRFRICWDFATMLCLLYTACAIPYKAAFFSHADGAGRIAGLAFDFLVDLFFLSDLWLRSSSFLVVADGKLVSEKAAIRQLYLKRQPWWTDLFSAAPFEVLACVPRWQLDSVFLLRLSHLARLPVRLFRSLDACEYHLTRAGIRVSSSITLILRMLLLYILTNHWYSCVWFAIHRFTVADKHFTWAMTSVMPISAVESVGHDVTGETKVESTIHICGMPGDGDSSGAPIGLSECYTRAFYMVITTMSTVGYGDIYPTNSGETLWEIIVVLTGCSLFASIIGAWQALLNQIDETGSNAFKEKMLRIRNYMSYRQFPVELRNEITLHYTHMWYSSRVLDEAAVVRDLPTPLRMEIAFAVKERDIMKIPVLRGCSGLTKKRVADVLKNQVAATGTGIYDAGDVGSEIYFITAGYVRITLIDTKEKPIVRVPGGGTGSTLASVVSDLITMAKDMNTDRDAANEKQEVSSDSGSSSDSDDEPMFPMVQPSDKSTDAHPSMFAGLKRHIKMESGVSAFNERRMAKRRARVIGHIYRQGNHFGEGCLTSTSGVRIEASRAIAFTELMTITRDELEQVLAYLPNARRQDLITQLLTKNGDVTHTVLADKHKKSAAHITKNIRVRASDELDGQSKTRRRSTFRQVSGAVIFSQAINKKLKRNVLHARSRLASKSAPGKEDPESPSKRMSFSSDAMRQAATPERATSTPEKLAEGLPAHAAPFPSPSNTRCAREEPVVPTTRDILEKGSFTARGGRGIIMEGSFRDAAENIVTEGSFTLPDEHVLVRARASQLGSFADDPMDLSAGKQNDENEPNKTSDGIEPTN